MTNLIPIAGVQGLREKLEEFFLQAKDNSNVKRQPHYLLYQNGAQQSLIKVDMSQPSCQFHFYDVQGRPANNPEKRAIAEFLWKTCGEAKHHSGEMIEWMTTKEFTTLYFIDVGKRIHQAHSPEGLVSLANAYAGIEERLKVLEQEKRKIPSALGQVGMFTQHEEKAPAPIVASEKAKKLGG